MHYTESHNIPGLLLLLVDFEKAFDCVSWSFIENTALDLGVDFAKIRVFLIASNLLFFDLL